jgi:hypothetical protein
LPLRARIDGAAEPATDALHTAGDGLWPTDACGEEQRAPTRGAQFWRMARPDVFSVRNTSVEDYLQPMVHEVKVSRADLLSDLRHPAKRESYRWLSCETYYVFPAGMAEPAEIPQEFGVWVMHDAIDSGTLERVRPAAHVPCKLPFAVWMSLAKAAPLRGDAELSQRELGELKDEPELPADGTANGSTDSSTDSSTPA